MIKQNLSKVSKIIWGLWLTVLFGGIIFLVAISYNWLNAFGEMPDLSEIENPTTLNASEVISADGVILGKYYIQNRTSLEYKDLSKHLKNALLATEDIRFFEHSGIDLRGLLRVAKGIITFNLHQGGGSTLSQQLAKNLYNTRSKALNQGWLNKVPILKLVIQKMKEWILSIYLEKHYSKEEVMTMYLNTVTYGSNTYGIASAANAFFQTHPSDLAPQQAAVLTGVLASNTSYSPILHPEKCTARRNQVLRRMNRYGFLTAEEKDQYIEAPLGVEYFKSDSHNKGLATYFRSKVKSDMKKWCKKNGYNLYTDGLKIYTSIDAKMQQHAEDAVKEHLTSHQKIFFDHWKGRNPWIDRNYREIKGYLQKAMKKTERYRSLKKQYPNNPEKIEEILNTKRDITVFTWENEKRRKKVKMSPYDSLKYYKHILHAGMMSMDPYSGHIKTWVGDIDHYYFKYDHVKQGRRQPGSTFKPIVYSRAIELNPDKFSPCFQVVDVPYTFQMEGGKTWTPKGSTSGKGYTLRQALARSINSVAAFLTKEVGPDEVVKNARNLGVTSPLDTVPSICLGSSDVSLYELVGVYGTFVNQGTWTEPIYILKIEDKHGKVLENFTPKIKEALSEYTAYTMTYMLRGGVEEPGGTSAPLRKYSFSKDLEVGGKTGTTSNNSDGWYMGITKDLVAGVWVGGEEPVIHFRSTYYGQGMRQAQPVFAKFMEKVYTDPEIGLEKGPFPIPDDITIVQCDSVPQEDLDDVEILEEIENL